MTREEAIKVVKSATVYTPKEIEALETLIPGLTESEDERIRKALIPVVDRLLGTINFPFTEEQVLNWFEKQKEQKPAEWSDEDEEILEHFLGWLQGTMGEKTYSSWLKSLPERFSLQPKREWSDEDRHAIVNCEYAIKETFKDEQNPHRIGTLDWLKSLRPDSYKNCNSRWKPSEEQMEYLAKGIIILGEGGNYKTSAVLNELRNDLKKLL